MAQNDVGSTLRDARPDELEAAGLLASAAYAASGEAIMGPFSEDYEASIRDARGRAETAHVLVAADADGTLLGTVTLAESGTPHSHVAGPGEWEFRMLGVAETARGRGIGSALVEECLFRAGLAGATGLAMSVYVGNTPAARMYERMGFVRHPERDWTPEKDIRLQVSSRPLHCGRCGELRSDGDHTACDAALALEPPRYCPACKRRMTVQVRPTGWTATCSAHGTAVR